MLPRIRVMYITALLTAAALAAAHGFAQPNASAGAATARTAAAPAR